MKTRLTDYEYITSFTRAYQETAQAPIALREARCLAVAARYLYLPPQKGDLLCGRLAVAPLGLSSEPLLARSVGFYWDPKLLATMADSPKYTPAQQEEIAQIVRFWQGEETRRRVRARFPVYMQEALPEDIYWEHSEAAFPLYRMVGVCLDYEKLLRLGLPGLREEVREKGLLAKDKALFSGMEDALDTLCDVCLRYAEDARTMGDATLAAALIAITQRAPRTFLEAAQLAWLYSLASGALNYGRMDVYLGSFLARDLTQGELDEARALDLVCSLWRLIDARKTVFHGRVVIGGRGRPNEADADRFALLAIQASRLVGEAEPQLSLRFYDGQNPLLMQKALDCIGTGCTYPILYNDEPNIAAARHIFGVSEEEAEQYMMFGCGEYVLDHRSFGTPNGVLNLLKALELTLTGGVDLMTGARRGIGCKGLAGYATFEELYAAYQRQVLYYVEIMAQQQALQYHVVAETAPFLYMTMLYDDCLARGKAIFDGGVRYLCGTLETYGNINTANSLFAIRELVYRQKALAPERLLAALQADFQGYEHERHLLEQAEKFGNDLDGVDTLAQELHRFVCSAALQQAPRCGLCSYAVVLINNEANTILGRFTAASADGRRSRAPMANANNPSGGTDKNGLTAMLNSLVKLDTRIHAGAVQNMKFSRALFGEKRPLLEAVLKTYFRRGGQQAMISVLSREELEDALVHPERHQGLMVRVGGFSAHFITLSPDVQQEIMSRTLY